MAPGAAALIATRHAGGRPTASITSPYCAGSSAAHVRAPSARACAALLVAIGEHDVAAAQDEQPGEHQPHRAAAEHRCARALVGGGAGARDRMDGGGERLGHRRPSGLETIRDGVQRRRRRRDLLGEAAQHPRHALAQLRAAGDAERAAAAGDGIADEDALGGVVAHADGLMAEAGGVGTEDQVPVAQALGVGRAGGRGLYGDYHLAVGGCSTSSTRRSPGPYSNAALMGRPRP